MGSATYYLKAIFATEAAAETAFETVETFFEKAGKAHDFWQAERNSEDVRAFWKEFTTQYPAVERFLREDCNLNTVDGDCNNALAGNLSFGSIPDFEVVDSEIRISEYTWHLADWTSLVHWFKRELGAIAAGWLSEEDVSTDYFSLIEVS